MGGREQGQGSYIRWKADWLLSLQGMAGVHKAYYLPNANQVGWFKIPFLGERKL